MRPGAEDQDGRTGQVLSGQEVGWRRVRSAPDTWRLEARVSSSLPSKPAVMVFAGLISKLVTTVFFSLASKLVATVFSSLASKPVLGFLVEPQNQCGGGFFSLGLKTDSSGLMICVSKSPRRFFGLGLKTK
jgi:hypothetical protein